jgi:hypothetical protein
MLRSLSGIALLLVALPSALSQDTPRQDSLSQPAITQESVEMFTAIDRQWIEVRYIPIDSAKGTLVMKNLVDRVVLIEMPDGFAAQPILAQFGQAGLGNGFGQGGPGGQNAGGQNAGGQNAGGQNGGAGTQTVGGNANAAGGQPAGIFRIPPGRSIKKNAVTVCLEHGKADPKPNIPYQLMRLESLVHDPLLAGICSQLNSPQLDQVSGQAAAWHVANNMNWKHLSDLPAHQSKYLPAKKLFSTKQIQSARAFVDGTRMTLTRSDLTQTQKMTTIHTTKKILTTQNSDQTY